jgi:hypothetical protein
VKWARVKPLEPGALVVDTERDRLGQVMGHEGPYVQLRPVAGGREWDAYPAGVRPVTDEERLGPGREQVRASLRAGQSGAGLQDFRPTGTGDGSAGAVG